MRLSLLFVSIFTFTSCTSKASSDMGFFDRLFGNKQSSDQPLLVDTTVLSKTADMLDEELYWLIIDQSLRNSHNQDEQAAYLVKAIGQLTPKQMIGFRLRTDKLLYDTYTSDMWCAAYIMNQGCSDDSFEYFRNWVISRGKAVYYAAKANPDSLISEVDEEAEMYDFEDFWYVANDAFQQKTGKDLYDFIDNEHFKTKEGQYPEIQFTWEEDEPESMRKICPKLFAQCWEQ
ncbi:DUF4240 domain-containing protein [Phnomibacter sp.]|uniref:DUF4240 domain-containing protein n=1 Tax=Phnomibacter sp. TaxID=2836217 RepID=UPI002FDCC739